MDREQVAEVLTEIATLLELKGENPFKTRAYTNAARTLDGLAEPLDKVVAEQRLGELKGIGDALQQALALYQSSSAAEGEAAFDQGFGAKPQPQAKPNQAPAGFA